MNDLIVILPDRKNGKYPHPIEPVPTNDQLQAWVLDSVCEATDGCTVEPDGVCPHGFPSWLLHLGLI